jgi:hypothetical protein
MRIGILTYWRTRDNYGTVLQHYALQKYLRNAGHDAYLIRYTGGGDITKLSWKKKIKKFMLSFKIGKILLHQRYKKVYEWENYNQRNFETFQSKYINQSKKTYHFYDELLKEPPEADAYIAGSDQVWNFSDHSLDGAKAKLHAFFLDFGNSGIKRISYAASFGKENLQDDFMREIAPLLQKFYYVSVREETGINICKQCGIDNAEFVPDPTMLLNADMYRVLYENEPIRKPKKSYCLLYLLSDNHIGLSVQAIHDWAKKENLDIIYIVGNGQNDDYKKLDATIPEWIYLLENAEYVISNSYHCSVFSLIFEKKFGVVPIIGSNTGMNSRFYSLFKLFQLEERFIINSDFSILDKEIDWQSTSVIFQELRSACKLLKVL